MEFGTICSHSWDVSTEGKWGGTTVVFLISGLFVFNNLG